jgi:hypothetical protein
MQDRRELHELECGLHFEQRLLLRYESELAGQIDVASRVSAEHADRALRRRGQAAQHADERGLAGSVRAEQCGDAGADGEGDVGDRHEIAEPLRYVVDRDDRGRRWRRRRLRHRYGRDRGHRVTASRR